MFTVMKIAGCVIIVLGVLITAFNFFAGYSTSTYPLVIQLAGATLCLVPMTVLGGVLLLAADGMEKARRRRRL